MGREGGHWSIWLRLLPEFIFEMSDNTHTQKKVTKNCIKYISMECS